MSAMRRGDKMNWIKLPIGLERRFKNIIIPFSSLVSEKQAYDSKTGKIILGKDLWGKEEEDFLLSITTKFNELRDYGQIPKDSFLFAIGYDYPRAQIYLTIHDNSFEKLEEGQDIPQMIINEEIK